MLKRCSGVADKPRDVCSPVVEGQTKCHMGYTACKKSKKSR